MRALVFDAVVLATALDALSRDGKPQNDVGRGEDQLAVETALIKFRSLYDFLQPENPRKDDLVVTDFVDKYDFTMPNADKFRTSVNKYSAHLTWTRTKEQWDDAFLPRSDSLRDPCERVLKAAWDVISEAISKGYRLNNYGQKYYKRLNERMSALGQSPENPLE